MDRNTDSDCLQISCQTIVRINEPISAIGKFSVNSMPQIVAISTTISFVLGASVLSNIFPDKSILSLRNEG